MKNISIGQLDPADWKKYRDIRLEALKIEPTAYLNTYEDVVKDTEKDWYSRLDDSKKKSNSIILFAFDHNGVIGMVGCYWDTRERIKHIGRIFGTYVKPAFRGKGIGKLLMEAIINELRSIPFIKKIRIEVNSKNTTAFELYKKMGFKIIGTAQKELFINGVSYDEVLMEMIV